MFQTADWNDPHVGGLLTQVIVKEEAQLQQKRGAHTVRHIWDHKYIDERPSYWKDPKPRTHPAGQLQLTSADAEAQGTSQKAMQHLRQMDLNLTALKRSSAVGDGGATQFAAFTPQLYSDLHPTYGVGQKCVTQTSSQMIGLGNDRLGVRASRYCRDDTRKTDFVAARNIPDRAMVEAGQKRWAAAPAPIWLRPTEKARLRHQQVEDPAAYPFAHRSPTSAFCLRPSELPLPGALLRTRGDGSEAAGRAASTRPW
jgi:hypothetical protein